MNVLMECLSFVTHALVDCSSFFSFLISPPQHLFKCIFLSSFVPFFPFPKHLFSRSTGRQCTTCGWFSLVHSKLIFLFLLFIHNWDFFLWIVCSAVRKWLPKEHPWSRIYLFSQSTFVLWYCYSFLSFFFFFLQLNDKICCCHGNFHSNF